MYYWHSDSKGYFSTTTPFAEPEKNLQSVSYQEYSQALLSKARYNKRMQKAQTTSRVMSVLALIILVHTIVMLVIGNLGWMANGLNIVLTIGLIGIYTYNHLNNNRINLFRHEQGCKMTKTQTILVDVLEYKLPMFFLGIGAVLYVIAVWSFRLSVIALVVYGIYYLVTH